MHSSKLYNEGEEGNEVKGSSTEGIRLIKFPEGKISGGFDETGKAAKVTHSTSIVLQNPGDS